MVFGPETMSFFPTGGEHNADGVGVRMAVRFRSE